MTRVQKDLLQLYNLTAHSPSLTKAERRQLVLQLLSSFGVTLK